MITKSDYKSSSGTSFGRVTPILVIMRAATLQPYSRHDFGSHCANIPVKKPATSESPAPVVSTIGALGVTGFTLELKTNSVSYSSPKLYVLRDKVQGFFKVPARNDLDPKQRSTARILHGS